jgi:hypothetical protein
VFGKERTPFTPAPVDNRRREFTPAPVDRVSPVEPPPEPKPDGYTKLFEDINRATDVEPPPAPKSDEYAQLFEDVNRATDVEPKRTMFDPIDQPVRRYSYRFVGNQRVAIPR